MALLVGSDLSPLSTGLAEGNRHGRFPGFSGVKLDQERPERVQRH